MSHAPDRLFEIVAAATMTTQTDAPATISPNFTGDIRFGLPDATSGTAVHSWSERGFSGSIALHPEFHIAASMNFPQLGQHRDYSLW